MNGFVSTKTIRLEHTSNSSAFSCTAALRRFCTRLGAPAKIYSDNGLNFVESRNELKLLQMNSIRKFGKESLINAVDAIGITWTKFRPGVAHFGKL